MIINKKVGLYKHKHRDLGNVMRLSFNNNGSAGTIFTAQGKESNITDLVESLEVTLSLETAKKLGEALLKLSKGK